MINMRLSFNRIISLLFFFVLLLAVTDNGAFAEGKPLWTRQMGTSSDDRATSVAVDGSGNVYVTGDTGGGLDDNTNAGGSDLFLVKYDGSGVKQWTRQMGTSVDESVRGVAVDGSGNVYVTGRTYGGLDGNTNAGSYDLFLVKYDSFGVKQWTRQMGTSTNDYAYGVAVDGSGNVYVTGVTGSGLDGNTSAGLDDLFLVKYDSFGVKQWTRQMGTSVDESARGVAVDGSGNVYVTGDTSGGLDGNTNAGSNDLFLVKYDGSGVKQWTRQMGTSTNDYAYGVAVDGSGNVYVTGVTFGGLDGNTNAGSNDLFLVKYDGSGVKQWTRQMGTSASDIAHSVAVDGSGNVYVTGDTSGGLDGQWHDGGSDIFLIKFSGGGIKRWTRQMGTGGMDYAYGVAVDGSSNVYVTGYTNGGLDCNTNAGSNDLFLVKYDGRDWTRQMGTSTPDYAKGVAVDVSGNVYVTGYTDGGLDGNTNAGYHDLFLVKYDSAGVKQWTRQMGTSTSEEANGVAVDGSGNVYVTGVTFGGLDGNTNAGWIDLFLVKYDGSGVKQWTRQMGTSTNDYAYGVAVDVSGNVYVTGYTDGGLDGNTNAGSNDLFLVKYDGFGVKQWMRQMGTNSDDRAYGVAVDVSGNVYVTGYTGGGLDGNTKAGYADLFLVKYDSFGVKQWTRQMGSSTNDFANGVAVDGSGNVYVTGYTDGGLDGNTSAGSNDLFLVKYDSIGVKQWTRQMGTSTSEEAKGVAVDVSGNVYVTGYTDGGLDGNTNAGYHDLFLVKYDSAGVKQWTRQLGTSANDYAYGVAVTLGGDLYIEGASYASFDGNFYQGSADIVLLKYSIAQDTTIPTGSILINGGTASVNSSFISVNLSCTDPGGCREMQFSNDSSSWSASETYTSIKLNWDMTASAYGGTAGDGTKTVYAKFMDNTWNWSVAYSDTIILDTTLPTGTVAINSNNTYTNSNVVMLDITGSDLNGVSQMQFNNDNTNWSAAETFNTTWAWLLSSGDGTKTVYAKVKDNAGNWSTAFSDTITLDSTAPSTTATPPGNTYTTAQIVSLTCDDGTGSGCASTYYCLGAGCNPATLYSTPLTFSANTTLRYYTKDILGNTEAVNEDVYTLVQTATSLSMELSAPRILSGHTVDAVGQLMRLPENGASRNGLTIRFEITGPSPVPPVTQTTTYTDSGLYSHTISGFITEGTYTIKAVFDGDGLLLPGESPEMSVYVGPSAGYAIIVEGKIPNNDGLSSHNKTTNRIYQKLRARGFSDDDIYYFNYDTGQAGVDEAPTKQAIQDAVRLWAKWKMNFIAAPLYIIMTNHGSGTDGIYLDNDNITPSDLSGWLDVLEGGLNSAALQKKRIVIVGACYSGSFIPVVSKSGRVVISSSADNEVSHKGPYENDSGQEIRSGEFFLEELFTSLERGASLRAAFEEATEKTEVFTRRNNASWAGAPYFDNAVQHPLLDDNGDTVGSNVLSDDGDGSMVKDLYFGVGNYYVPNSATNPAEVTEVTETVFLTSSPSDNSHTMWAEVNDDDKVDGGRIWFEVRPPSMALSGTGGSGQSVADYVYNFLLYTSPTHWEKSYSGFDEYGKYEIFYFVRDEDTQKVSPMKRSVVYKDKPGNNPPDAFNLTSPADTSEQTTIVLLQWEDAVDPDGDAVTYTVMISEDDTFATVDYIKEEITHNATVIGSEAGLEDLTTYYWKVVAIDAYGRRTESSQVWSFHTDDHNGFPDYIAGYITDSSTGAGLAGTATRDSNGDHGTARSDGYYIFSTDSGSNISVTASKAGYTSKTKTVNLVAGNTASLNFALVSVNTPPTANAGGPYSGPEGQAIILNGSGSTDPDGSITKYEWDVDNIGTYDYTSTTSATQSHTYAQQGIYTVKLKVTDNKGATATTTTTATISDTTPAAHFTAAPTNVTALQSVNFTNGSTGYDTPLTYAWDFDNNGTTDSTLQNPSAVYNAGTYTVKLTVTDADNSTNTLIQTNYISVCYSNANIVGSSVTYSSLQAAYNAAQDGNTIQSNAVTIVENIDFNRNITVTIQGGYNCDHSAVTGITTINGKMTISNGQVTIENLIIQ
jgi:PKD repeat protein